jgi:hypothetical protein
LNFSIKFKLTEHGVPPHGKAVKRWATSVSSRQTDMMKTHSSILIAILFLTSCTDQHTQPKGITNGAKHNLKEVQQSAQSPLLDSVINLPTGNFDPNENTTVTQEEAERQLYSHFKRKGIFSRSEWQLKSTSSLKDQMVDFDTVYNLHSQQLSGAVISYWLGTVDRNGHCFQPQKALLLNTRSGYKVAKEQILPPDFIIDSVSEATVYGYEYECGGKGVIRQFRLSLR